MKKIKHWVYMRFHKHKWVYGYFGEPRFDAPDYRQCMICGKKQLMLYQGLGEWGYS